MRAFYADRLSTTMHETAEAADHQIVVSCTDSTLHQFDCEISSVRIDSGRGVCVVH